MQNDDLMLCGSLKGILKNRICRLNQCLHNTNITMLTMLAVYNITGMIYNVFVHSHRHTLSVDENGARHDCVDHHIYPSKKSHHQSSIGSTYCVCWDSLYLHNYLSDYQIMLVIVYVRA